MASRPEALKCIEGYLIKHPHIFPGTTSLIRRIVTATTTRVFHENQVPKVEVHISPATETIIDPNHHDDDDNESVMTTGGGPQLNSTSHTEYEHYQQQQRGGGSRDQHMTSTMTSSSSYRTGGKQQRDGYDYDGTSFRGNIPFIIILFNALVRVYLKLFSRLQ